MIAQMLVRSSGNAILAVGPLLAIVKDDVSPSDGFHERVELLFAFAL